MLAYGLVWIPIKALLKVEKLIFTHPQIISCTLLRLQKVRVRKGITICFRKKLKLLHVHISEYSSTSLVTLFIWSPLLILCTPDILTFVSHPIMIPPIEGSLCMSLCCLQCLLFTELILTYVHIFT